MSGAKILVVDEAPGVAAHDGALPSRDGVVDAKLGVAGGDVPRAAKAEADEPDDGIAEPLRRVLAAIDYAGYRHLLPPIAAALARSMASPSWSPRPSTRVHVPADQPVPTCGR